MPRDSLSLSSHHKCAWLTAASQLRNDADFCTRVMVQRLSDVMMKPTLFRQSMQAYQASCISFTDAYLALEDPWSSSAIVPFPRRVLRRIFSARLTTAFADLAMMLGHT